MNTAKHIAIIMDGNGRWAEQQGKNVLLGMKPVQKLLDKLRLTVLKILKLKG